MFVWKWASNPRFQQVFSKGQVAMTQTECIWLIFSDWMKDIQIFQIDRFWRCSIFGSSTKLSQICHHVHVDFHVSSHLLCFILFPISFQVSKLYMQTQAVPHSPWGAAFHLKEISSKSPSAEPDSLLEVHPSTLFDPCWFETWATWISIEVVVAEWVGKVWVGVNPERGFLENADSADWVEEVVPKITSKNSY